MCVTIIYFLLVKLIKFFLYHSIYCELPVMVNKDFQNLSLRILIIMVYRAKHEKTRMAHW